MVEKSKEIINHDKAKTGQKDNQYEDYAVLLSRVISGITKSFLLEIAGKVSEQLRPLISELKETTTKCQQIMYSQQAIEKQLEALISQNKLLEGTSKENRLLTEQHYQERIVEPMIRLLFPVFDAIEDAKYCWSGKEQVAEQRFGDILDQIHVQLAQFLLIYAIEPVKHRPGADFDPKVMKPIKFIPTKKKELNSRVAKRLQIGFRQGDQRILRPESVALYRYEPSEADPVKESKGGNYVTRDRCRKRAL